MFVDHSVQGLFFKSNTNVIGLLNDFNKIFINLVQCFASLNQNTNQRKNERIELSELSLLENFMLLKISYRPKFFEELLIFLVKLKKYLRGILRSQRINLKVLYLIFVIKDLINVMTS